MKVEISSEFQQLVAANLELEKVRVGIARVAQKLGLDDNIPGCSVGASFSELTRAARREQRGWNALLAAIIDEIEKLQRG